jgi:cytidyltransferase-like protein
LQELDILKAIYAAKLQGAPSNIGPFSAALGEPAREVELRLEGAVREGLVVMVREGEAELTVEGRGKLKVVMIGGAFEIIHPGHLHTIEEARGLGNTLVAIVAADSTVLKNKGREPVTTQDWRVRLVMSVKGVDVAMAGGRGSIYDTLANVRPDVVALGYDQTHDPAVIEAEAKKRGMDVKVVRLSSPLPGVKTSKIVGAL